MKSPPAWNLQIPYGGKKEAFMPTTAAAPETMNSLSGRVIRLT